MIEYPWYELTEEDDELTQGDILKNCPVPILEKVSYDINDEGNSVDAEIQYIDGIILTQACDLANCKTENVILCNVTSRVDFEKILESRGRSKNDIKHDLKGIVKGQQYEYYIINNYKTDKFEQDYYIVDFEQIFSIPLTVAKKIAKNNGKRLHLCPPYREHLSQAFARYFMRVGLPIDIKIE